MAVPSSNEQAPDAAHFADLEHAWHTSTGDTLVELLAYFEDMIVFLQHFNEQTSVHEIKAFLASLERGTVIDVPWVRAGRYCTNTHDYSGNGDQA